MTEEYRWKNISVIGFDELMAALDRADRKGYMPDAIREEWEAFNWRSVQPKPTWVGLTENERDEICLGDEGIARAIEEKLKEKNA